MKLSEFIDKDLLIDENLKVYNQDLSRYKTDDNKMEYLDVSNKVAVELIRCQVEDEQGIELLENVEEYK